MSRVALLIAASPTAAFYSQVAALSLAIRKLPWSRWEPSIHIYVGGAQDDEVLARWRPHLRNVEFSWVSDTRFAAGGDWAQSDDVFRFAPRDADVLLAIDADTFPVDSLENALDRVVETGAVGAVIAHYPTVLSYTWDQQTSSFVIRGDHPRFPGTSLRDTWSRLAEGLVDVPLEFEYSHTLMPPDSPPEHRNAPFYPNFGFVLFPRPAFDAVAPLYLAYRTALMERLPEPDFPGQAALTLATTAAGIETWAMPMRYNFPNDPVAGLMYPAELERVAVFHYLRTTSFDRHQIFTSEEQYSRFLELTLSGVDLRFQQSVKSIIGSEYPFR